MLIALQLFEVVTETGMPHLEENLRYSVTQEQLCLSERRLATAFPILQHVSLADCTLQERGRGPDTISYSLVCEGGHGTTGAAEWTVANGLVRGTLNVRLGGKNMTFFQRITARPLGECPAAPPAAIVP